MLQTMTTRMLGFAEIILLLFIAACNTTTNTPLTTNPAVDPSRSYTGSRTQALITQTNAEALALGAFTGDNVGASVGNVSLASKKLSAQNGELRIQELSRIVKSSIRRMGIPRSAQQAKTARYSKSTPVSGKTENYQIQGTDGGTATYTMEINDYTGSFTGSIVYADFSSQGIVLSGSTTINGSLDATLQELRSITQSFSSLSMSGADFSITLVGSLSWIFHYDAASETLSMNMVIIDSYDSKTYWLKNHEIATVYYDTYLTQSISGQYYDHDHGYVDITTEQPLVAYYGNSWPSQGALISSGLSDTWVRLTFLDDHLSIDADTDGDFFEDWHGERPTNDHPAVNSPPIADAGPDQNVSQWAVVSLDGSASHDPDGDPLSYFWSFQSCPQNVCPGLTGYSSAAPSFVAQLTGSYVLRLTVYDGNASSVADTVTVTATGTAPSDPSSLTLQWQYGIFGTYIGKAGLFVADLNNDGIPAIIASASGGGFSGNSFWYILRRTTDGSYAQVWRSEFYPTTLVRLVLADMNGDGYDDVVVGLSDGKIHFYDGQTRLRIGGVTAAASLTDLAVGDLDGSGTREIITSNGTGVFVYSAGTGSLLWSLPSGGGSSLAVGNVDADDALEIVTTTNGGKGYVIDGVTHAVQWEYINSFGAQVKLADLDNDGMQEIVGAAAWYKITLFDADIKTPTWEIATSLDIDAVRIADVNGDGVLDILYGDRQSGGIHAIDTQTHVQNWSLYNSDGGISGIATGDVDKDGAIELLFGAGGNSTGADHLYVVDPSTKTIEWKSKHVDGPLSAVAVGDVDDDGHDEIVMVSFESDSGYAEGIIHIFDATTHALEYQEKLGVSDWMGVRSVKIGDVDGDGNTEFVITTANLYDGFVRVYDGAAHTVKKQSASYSGNYFSALAIGDVDGDGKTEIVAGQGREHTGALGVYLIVYDGTTLAEKWKSVDLGSYWGEVYDIKLHDVDADGHAEIIASVSGSMLYVYDGVNHSLKALTTLPARALEVADIDNDGVSEILVGRTDGMIDVFDPSTYTVKKTVSTFDTAAVNALRIADLDGNGTADWLVTRGNLLVILNAQDQGLKWQSGDLSGNPGLYNHLGIKDADGDGHQEVYLGSNVALYQFE